MISAWRFLASRLLLVPLMTKFISETSLWQGIVAWNRRWQMKGMSFRQHFEDIEDILDTKDTKTQGFNWALDKIDTTGWVPGHQEGVLGLWKHPRLPQRKHYDQLAMTGSLQKCKYEFHRCEKHNIHDDLFKFEKHPPCVVFLKQWTFVHLLVPLNSCFLLDSSLRQCFDWDFKIFQ